MTDTYIQWSKLLDLFLKYAHFKSERKRRNVHVLIICICLSLQTMKLWI